MAHLDGCGFSPRNHPRGDTRRDYPGDDSKEKDTNMNRLARLPVLAAVSVAMLASMTGCNQLKARMELNKGVAAFKAGKPEQAITHFQDAAKFDPKLITAKEYLATALAQNVVSGLTSKDNLKTAQEAIDTYQAVLVDRPESLNSLKGIASLYYNINDYPKAKEWQKRVLAVDPKDPEAAYSVGVVDWHLAHDNIVKMLPAGTNDDGAGNAKVLVKGLCTDVQQKNGALVEEGLKYLNQAIENRPSYDDAMSYLNLTYRRKADIDCGNEAARKEDVAKGNEWLDKAMGTRKANEAKKDKGPGGIVMDSNGNMK
jgi:tetratricopeptide (TPR) repeat protein